MKIHDQVSQSDCWKIVNVRNYPEIIVKIQFINVLCDYSHVVIVEIHASCPFLIIYKYSDVPRVYHDFI